MPIVKSNLPILHPALTLPPLPRGTDRDLLTPLLFFLFSISVSRHRVLSCCSRRTPSTGTLFCSKKRVDPAQPVFVPKNLGWGGSSLIFSNKKGCRFDLAFSNKKSGWASSIRIIWTVNQGWPCKSGSSRGPGPIFFSKKSSLDRLDCPYRLWLKASGARRLRG